MAGRLKRRVLKEMESRAVADPTLRSVLGDDIRFQGLVDAFSYRVELKSFGVAPLPPELQFVGASVVTGELAYDVVGSKTGGIMRAKFIAEMEHITPQEGQNKVQARLRELTRSPGSLLLLAHELQEEIDQRREDFFQDIQTKGLLRLTDLRVALPSGKEVVLDAGGLSATKAGEEVVDVSFKVRN